MSVEHDGLVEDERMLDELQELLDAWKDGRLVGIVCMGMMRKKDGGGQALRILCYPASDRRSVLAAIDTFHDIVEGTGAPQPRRAVGRGGRGH